MSGYNLKFYRDLLACTQEEMAEFLGTNRNLLAYAESGRSHLETPSITRLAKLVQQIEDAQNKGYKASQVNQKVSQFNTAARRKLERQSDKLHKSLKAMKKKLQKVTKAFEQAQQALHTLLYIQQHMEDLLPHQKTWITLKIQDAQDLLAANDFAVQHDLTIKVKSIEASIEAVNQLLGNEFDIIRASFALLERTTEHLKN